MTEERRRMTLAEMAAQSVVGTGRPVCPRCHCADFRTYRTTQGHAATFRYRSCRNCGHKVFTMQPPEQVLRDVESEDTDDLV